MSQARERNKNKVGLDCHQPLQNRALSRYVLHEKALSVDAKEDVADLSGMLQVQPASRVQGTLPKDKNRHGHRGLVLHGL